jgi:hypothetical protein
MVLDAWGYAVDANSQLPPHLLPRASLVNQHGARRPRARCNQRSRAGAPYSFQPPPVAVGQGAFVASGPAWSAQAVRQNRAERAKAAAAVDKHLAGVEAAEQARQAGRIKAMDEEIERARRRDAAEAEEGALSASALRGACVPPPRLALTKPGCPAAPRGRASASTRRTSRRLGLAVAASETLSVEDSDEDAEEEDPHADAGRSRRKVLHRRAGRPLS